MPDRVVAYDAHCECGANMCGMYSGDEAEHWAETHQCLTAEGETAVEQTTKAVVTSEDGEETV